MFNVSSSIEVNYDVLLLLNSNICLRQTKHTHTHSKSFELVGTTSLHASYLNSSRNKQAVIIKVEWDWVINPRMCIKVDRGRNS